MTLEPTVEEARRAFGKALRDAMAVRKMTQQQLGAALDVKQPTISSWITGEAAPATAGQTFAIERALNVPPGSLSRHLGYLPPEAVKSSPGVEAAVLEDPTLTPAEKDMLLGAYRAALASKRPPTGRPRKRS